ncbi:MAG TPA: glycosyltransferase [Polyangia bacterium]|jgi:glycosyltransferase involved in cell wall biosynthesis
MFAAFVERVPGSLSAAVVTGGRVGLVLAAGEQPALPWFVLAAASLLRRNGHAVSLLWIDQESAGDSPDFATQTTLIGALAKHLPWLEVIRLGAGRSAPELAQVLNASRAFDRVVVPDAGGGSGARLVEAARVAGVPVCRWAFRAGAIVVRQADAENHVATAFTPDPDDFAVWSRLAFDVVASDDGVQTLLSALTRPAAVAAPIAAADRPLIATSLAPVRIDRQREAVQSWIEQGFDVLSINSADEITLLAPQFPSVRFWPAARDARAMAGKPLVSLDDVLAGLRAANRSLSAIVNSDIVLGPLGGRRLADAVKEIAVDGFAFNKRLDQESESDPGLRYDDGIDAFFFGRKLLADYPSTPYFLGLPWWDYFFTAYPLLAGHPTVEIKEPIAFHLTHKNFYDVAQHWSPLAFETQRLLAPLLAGKDDLLHESGMDLALQTTARLTAGKVPAGGKNTEEAFMLFAKAMMQLLRDGTTPTKKTYRPPRVRGGAGLRLGIATIADGRWPGGAARINHLVAALAGLPAEERPRLSLLVDPAHAASAALYAPTFPLVDEIIQIGFSQDDWRHQRRLSVRGLDDVFAHVDFLFPLHEQALAGRPAASWIDGFPHHHLMGRFTDDEIARRKRASRIVARTADLLVLSSHAVRHDWELLCPEARPRVRVLPWRAMPQPAWYALDPSAVAARHGITRPFLICSNQFDLHKGHGDLLNALAKLRPGQRPLIVSTGRTEDRVTPGVGAAVQQLTAKLGVGDSFRVLGLLPREEQLALMRASQAIIQPSLYEGWSLVVEEARALGKAMILNGIHAHLAQMPTGAEFFSPGDVDHCAERMVTLSSSLPPGPTLEGERRARQEAEALAREFAREVCALAREAIDLGMARRQAPAVSRAADQIRVG